MGRPIVAADHGGARETVLPGETGWLVKPNDADALAAGIKAALTLDPDSRHGLSARAMGFAMLAPSIPLAVGVWSLALGHGALWLGVGAAGSVVAFIALARWANPAHAVLKLR